MRKEMSQVTSIFVFTSKACSAKSRVLAQKENQRQVGLLLGGRRWIVGRANIVVLLPQTSEQ